MNCNDYWGSRIQPKTMLTRCKLLLGDDTLRDFDKVDSRTLQFQSINRAEW